jgi:hypothetical protein
MTILNLEIDMGCIPGGYGIILEIHLTIDEVDLDHGDRLRGYIRLTPRRCIKFKFLKVGEKLLRQLATCAAWLVKQLQTALLGEGENHGVQMGYWSSEVTSLSSILAYCSPIINSDVTCHIAICRSEVWRRSRRHSWSCRRVKV